MSTNFLTPHILKNGPEYNVMDVSWTIVTVFGYGKSFSNNFPITLLLELTTYHNKQKNKIAKTSFVCFLSAMLA
jgi:hypothetical protein